MNADNRSTPSAEFFVAGGTLPASAPSYVSRPADDQLFDAAAAGQFCYVLTTRQMGKSSLMVRTAGRLKQQGMRIAIVDLTTMGGKTEETWYLDFLTELSDQLNLPRDVEAWWQEHAALGPVRRFSNFLRDVVLEEIDDQIVIFVDEIDFTLGLPFADDFFAAVRATYNARALDARFNRLTFIFLGVAAPADLIKDRTRTPFNIGEGIVLRDFDRTDAAVLQQGLKAVYPGQGQAILDRIFYWTAGHPYLTQKLCREVVEVKHTGPWTDAEVDRVVNDLFLSDQTNREQNLQFVQDRVLKNPHRRELLKLYGKVRAGKPVINDEQSVLQNQLKLAGLVTTDDGNLRVHNEIYRVVFDTNWIKANTPRDSNRLVAYAAVALAVLVVGLAGFVLLYNSNVQQQSKQLELEFTQVDTPAERVDRLARLFDLQGILDTSNFDDNARRLFFDLNSRQDQLALFQVQDDRVVGVIEGLYTALADVNKSGENDELLTAMRDALQKPRASAEELRLKEEIDYWLKARAYARQNQYNDALAEYGKAIQANPEDSNPATHFERARIMLDLPSPVYPQALSDLDAAIAAAGKVSEAKSGGAEADATATPTPTQVVSSTPDATSVTAIATRVVGPTVLPTSGQTPVPVPAATGKTQPPPHDAGQRPFRSQFITFVQIASAVRRLIDSSPGLVAFVANSAESDYGNLRVAKLVRTLTPTPEVTNANGVKPSATRLTGTASPVLLTSFPPGSDVVNWKVVISDSFDTNDNHWNTGDINDPGNVTGTLQIIDSKYRWNIGANRDFATITSKSQAPDGDFYASVDAHQLDGSPVCGYGLLLRDTAAGVYQFGLANHDQQFSVFAWNEVKGTSRQLIDPAGSDAIHPGEVNRLAVIAEGAHYSFFINNQPIGEMTDNELTSGHVTLFTQLCQAGDAAVIEFDNMELRVPQATRPTSTSNPSLAPTLTVVPDAVAELFRRTNDLRQNNKLPPYTLNADLNQVALAHSQDMANRDELTDTGADGSTAVQRITNAGYGVGQPSEAICSGPGETVDGAWGKLTADSADLANLLNAVNTDIGIGVAQNQANTYYTIVFGKPAQAPTPVPPTPDPNEWRGEYYDNPNLQGAPVMVRNDPSVNFDWGRGSPAPNIPVDFFSARWTRTINFDASKYRFSARADDGVRVWLDSQIIIDEWQPASTVPLTFTADVTLTAGPHAVRVEYLETTLNAFVNFGVDVLR